MSEVSFEKFIPDGSTEPLPRGLPAHIWDDSWIMQNLPSHEPANEEPEIEPTTAEIKEYRKEWS